MLNNLIENEKYTLIIENDLGLIVSRKIRFKKAMLQAYAQHRETLVMHYILKGKRNATGTRYIDNKVVVAEGWQDIKGIFENKMESNKSFECMICDFNNTEFNNVIVNNNLKIVYQYNN